MRPQQTCCVLILEEEPIIALELSEALAAKGAESIFVSTIEKALKLLQEREFLGAIVDVSTVRNLHPETICDRLAKSSIPFVVHSGLPYRCEEAVATFTKPANPIAVVETLLDAMTFGPPRASRGPDNSPYSRN